MFVYVKIASSVSRDMKRNEELNFQEPSKEIQFQWHMHANNNDIIWLERFLMAEDPLESDSKHDFPS